MGLFDKLRNELVDIIEWIDDSRHTIAWRFPRYQNEIKNGAEVLVHRGEIADMFEPGNYKLTTDNIPILSTIMGWKHGFNSPFRSEVYFVSTRQITDLKWGTPNPIMFRDPDFGPIRLRAFGTYSLRAQDPKALLKELIGTDSSFEADEISELMRSILITALADLLGESKVAALDLASRYGDFSEQLRKAVLERVDDEYGLDIPQLNIVNISLPEEVEKAIDTRSSMGVIGDMNRFQQFQMGKMVQSPGMSAPPMPPQATWHIAVDGQSQGPYNDAQLMQMIQSGGVLASTNVWSPSLGKWMAAGQVPQLSGHFGAVPPPPPPS